MAKIQTIDVYTNPYCAIDADGLPQGVVRMPGTSNWVGAFVDLVATRQTGKTRFYFATPNAAKGEKGAHGLRRVAVPFTAETARAVLDGALIVATKEHARMVGIAETAFEEPEQRLRKERAIAQGHVVAHYGASSVVADIPLKPTVLAEGEEPRRADLVLSGPKDDPSLVLGVDEEA